MDREKAKELLKRQIALSHDVDVAASNAPSFLKWKRDTEVVIDKVFGASGKHLQDFRNISFAPMHDGCEVSAKKHLSACRRGMATARSLLESMIEEKSLSETSGDISNNSKASLENVLHLCQRFSLVAKQMSKRHGSRATLRIDDEYDVQDLFHALLKIYFEDVRAEEWTPSYAGSGSRVDFLLKREKLVLEIKMTRKGIGAKEIGEQLLIDIQRYRTHTDCRSLVCFVYDPDEKIVNPRGLEDDLNNEGQAFPVKVIIAS
jgi:hypothetical protein